MLTSQKDQKVASVADMISLKEINELFFIVMHEREDAKAARIPGRTKGQLINWDPTIAHDIKYYFDKKNRANRILGKKLKENGMIKAI